MKSIFIVSIFFGLLLLCACGQKSSGDGKKPQEQTFEEEGIFSTNLIAINEKYSKNLKSVVTISKFGDDFNVRIKFRNGPSGIHMQGLYSGQSCPFVDSNGDGVIDVSESENYIGKMVIPFDGDISGQDPGSDYYPSSQRYNYDRSTSFSLVTFDLSPDDRNLRLEGRVVVISGIPDSSSVPDTLSRGGYESPQKAVPIACGILTATTMEPEEDSSSDDDYKPEPRPRPDNDDDDEYKPEPEPEVEARPSIWRRIGSRIERWWNRIGGWFRGCRGDSCKDELL